MAGIFLSYRQGDTKAWAIGLRDDLARVFGDNQVFLDKDSLGPGNWYDQLPRTLKQCSVVLVVIGRQWLTVADEQQRPRLSLPEDVHRQEITLALGHPGVTVIPVLVDESVMPKAEQLPGDIRGLADQQAYKIGDTEARRKVDLEVLIKGIEKVTGLTAKPEVQGGKSTYGRPPWYKWDYTDIGIAFVLTVVFAMIGYSSDGFSEKEILVLLAISYGAAWGGKWLWRALRNRQKKDV